MQKFVKQLQLQKEETPTITIYYYYYYWYTTNPQHQPLCILSKQTYSQNHKWPENIIQRKRSCEICTSKRILANIVNFLSDVGPSSTTRHTVLIGQNPSVFDTPMLLQCAGLNFKQMLSSMNVSFAVSLHLVKTLTKSGHKSLNPGEKRQKAIFHLFLSHCLTKIFKHIML